MIFRFMISSAFAVISLAKDARAHDGSYHRHHQGEQHRHHDHHNNNHQHHHHQNSHHLRRLNPFSSTPSAKSGQCNTPDLADEERAKSKENFELWLEQKKNSKGTNNPIDRRNLGGCGGNCIDWSSTIITIPIHFHLFHNGEIDRQFTCRKTLDDRNYYEPYAESNCGFIQDQVKVLNKSFRGIKVDDIDTQYNADAKFQFCIAGANELDAALYDSKNFYDDNGEKYKSFFRTGEMETLNIWMNTGSGYLGYATHPKEAFQDKDGINLKGATMPGGGAKDGTRDLGDILTHEIGHWLDLEHTHSYGCNNKAVGDYMDLVEGGVTAYQREASTGCPDPSQDTCSNDGGNDPVKNFMGYTDDRCMDEFTPGQVLVMQSSWELYRHKIGYSEKWSVGPDKFTCKFDE